MGGTNKGIKNLQDDFAIEFQLRCKRLREIFSDMHPENENTLFSISHII